MPRCKNRKNSFLVRLGRVWLIFKTLFSWGMCPEGLWLWFCLRADFLNYQDEVAIDWLQAQEKSLFHVFP